MYDKNKNLLLFIMYKRHQQIITFALFLGFLIKKNKNNEIYYIKKEILIQY